MAAISDGTWLGGLARRSSEGFELLDDVFSFNHLSEDNMFAVQPLGLDSCDEELGSIRVGTGVGHGKEVWTNVLLFEVLVGELLSVDGFSAGSVTASEVAALKK